MLSVAGARPVRKPLVGAETVGGGSIADDHPMEDCTSSTPTQAVQGGSPSQEGEGSRVNGGSSVVSGIDGTQSSDEDSGAGCAPATPTATKTPRRQIFDGISGSKTRESRTRQQTRQL